MSILNDRRSAIKKLRLLVYTPKSDINSFRTRIEDAFAMPILPGHVECSEHDYGGVASDVLAPEIYSSRRVMLYIHGGSFVGGSRASYRGFCARLANKCYCRVVVPELRLAPAHPFPAAIEDVQAVFRALYTEEQVACTLDSDAAAEKSVPEILIAADGSGTSVAMALLFNLREKYRGCIPHVVFFSPWLDLSDGSVIMGGKKACDEVLTGESVRHSAETYTYASNLANPLVSPLKAAKEVLAGFPPFCIQCGGEELLLQDARTFRSLLESAGVKCELDEAPGMMHLYLLADEYLSEPHLAVERVGKLVAGADGSSKTQCFENKPVLENSVKADI